MTTETDPKPVDAVEAAPAEQAAADTAAEKTETEIPTAEPVAHIPMAERLPVLSWGSGSAPDVPAVDDSGSEGSHIEVTKSTTTSARSSVYEFVEEHGRTWHRYKAGKYVFPNDLQEQARLDLQHAIFLMMAHGKPYLAPIKEPKRVLDMCTGTGIWAIEFAQQHPDSHVVGTDLSPIQPDFIPPNCTFEIDDAEDEWTFSEPFDFIHGRAIISCFRHHDEVFRSAFNNLVPGGYLEIKDPTIPLRWASPPPEDCALVRLSDMMIQATRHIGRPWENAFHYPEYFRDIGFENIKERKFYWPLGPWPKGTYYKTLGTYVLEDLLNGLQGLTMKLGTALGWPKEDIEKLIEDVRKDVRNPKLHAYFEVHTIYGQKPGGPSNEAKADESKVEESNSEAKTEAKTEDTATS